ncbi:MAG TPA: YkgJ family cysteine cluster protein [Polyangiaceae bacterium]|nr:YkgJ family cysteine cluster protein [Polyangiaceae bacterium]
MSRSLPVLTGSEHLRFRCSGCGACCKGLRVSLTHRDLTRLLNLLGGSALRLVEWLAPDEVDMEGEPSSFVELRGGRRLMVLAQDAGACRFLDAEQRCSVYAARPADCQLFPFHLERDPQGLARELTLLPFEGCDYERDGDNPAVELVKSDAVRWGELADYQLRVASWNRLARHRRRFGHPAGDAAEFLAFLGVA